MSEPVTLIRCQRCATEMPHTLEPCDPDEGLDQAWKCACGKYAAEHEVDDALIDLQARLAAAKEALAFAACVIKSGEPWTDTCERIIGGALKGGDEG